MADRAAGDGSSLFRFGPRVDVSHLELDPLPFVSGSSVDRMREVVESLATGPRHVVDDHAAAQAAAELVKGRLDGLGLETCSVMAEALGVRLPTVWSEVPGTDSDALFVFFAHYDTVPGSPGADDNASGVAGVLEIARMLSEKSLPVATVVASGGFEETGTFAGARALATKLRADDRNIIGMISLEMIGFTCEPTADAPLAGDFLAIVGDDRSEPLIQTFHSAALRWLPQRALVPIAMNPEDNSNVRRSDHAAFWEFGVPAAMATDPN